MAKQIPRMVDEVVKTYPQAPTRSIMSLLPLYNCNRETYTKRPVAYDRRPKDVALVELRLAMQGRPLSIDRCAPGEVVSAGKASQEKCSKRLVRQICLVQRKSRLCQVSPRYGPNGLSKGATVRLTRPAGIRVTIVHIWYSTRSDNHGLGRPKPVPRVETSGAEG